MDFTVGEIFLECFEKPVSGFGVTMGEQYITGALFLCVIHQLVAIRMTTEVIVVNFSFDLCLIVQGFKVEHLSGFTLFELAPWCIRVAIANKTDSAIGVIDDGCS
jgi:hypothetical protein